MGDVQARSSRLGRAAQHHQSRWWDPAHRPPAIPAPGPTTAPHSANVLIRHGPGIAASMNRLTPAPRDAATTAASNHLRELTRFAAVSTRQITGPLWMPAGM